MSRGVNFIPKGTGMIFPVFLAPLPKSSNDFTSASFALSFNSPVYSSVAFAVNPLSYKLFMYLCDADAPEIVSRRICCTGKPVTPSKLNDVLKCMTSLVSNTY